MRADTIQIFALISICALADYDPIEFRRSTDLSKPELDRRINTLLSSDVVMYDEQLIAQAREQMDRLRSVEQEAQTQTELSFLLRQLSRSSLEQAYLLAQRYSREYPKESTASSRISNYPSAAAEVNGIGREEELLRLGVMRLAKDLPGYMPRFDYQLRHTRITCLLEPPSYELPPILVDAKIQIRSTEVRTVVSNLKKLTAGFGKNTLGVVLTTSASAETDAQRQKIPRGFFILTYDFESNKFITDSFSDFVDAVNGSTLSSSK